MKIIDHEPNKLETILTTIITVAVLVGLGLLLKWIKNTYGLPAGLFGCFALVVISFATAFWLERRR